MEKKTDGRERIKREIVRKGEYKGEKKGKESSITSRQWRFMPIHIFIDVTKRILYTFSKLVLNVSFVKLIWIWIHSRLEPGDINTFKNQANKGKQRRLKKARIKKGGGGEEKRYFSRRRIMRCGIAVVGRISQGYPFHRSLTLGEGEQ